MNTFIVNDAQDHIELFSEKPFKCGMFQMFIKGDMEPSIAEQIPTKKFSSLREDCKPSSIRQEPLQTVSVDVIFDLFTQTVFSLFVDLLLGSNREKGVCIILGEDKHF